jgi:hypothetical protein
MGKHREQVTCYCGVYTKPAFPHRINGGRCNGSSWAESYRRFESEMCHGCPFNSDDEETGCEVAGGRESIYECPAYWEHLKTQPDVRHPIRDPDTHFETIWSRFQTA